MWTGAPRRRGAVAVDSDARLRAAGPRNLHAVALLAVLLAVVSGAVLALDFFVRIPPLLAGIALVTWLLSLTVACGVAFVRARRSGQPVVASTAAAARGGLRWMWAFLP